MEYLSSADIVVALDQNGSIVSQSAPGDVHLKKEYVEALQGGHGITETGDAQEPPPKDKIPTKTSAQQPVTPELTRKVGDVSLYKFYLQSCGFFRLRSLACSRCGIHLLRKAAA